MSKDRIETTEKRTVEREPDGTSDAGYYERGAPAERVRTVERVVEPRIVRVKSGGGGAMMGFILGALLVGAGIVGFYMLQGGTPQQQAQKAETEKAQQQAAVEQKLSDIDQAAAQLQDQVRDAKRDLGVSPAPAAPSPLPVQPASPAPAPR